MTASTIKTWCWIHKWSSLVSTAFLLLLCITGLPLIFHHEIDELLGNAAEPRDLPAGTPHASLDRMVKAAPSRARWCSTSSGSATSPSWRRST